MWEAIKRAVHELPAALTSRREKSERSGKRGKPGGAMSNRLVTLRGLWVLIGFYIVVAPSFGGYMGRYFLTGAAGPMRFIPLYVAGLFCVAGPRIAQRGETVANLTCARSLIRMMSAEHNA